MKIIFSDIDGTLITSDLKISPRTQECLKRQVEQGVWLVPVSARMPEAIRPILMDFLSDYPIISYNGALVQDHKGEVLFSKTIAADKAQAVCQYLTDHWSGIAWNVYSFDRWLAPTPKADLVLREERIVGLSASSIALETIGDLPGVHKLLLMGEPDRIAALERDLLSRYPELSIARSTPYYIEVMEGGIDKGQAVTLLTEAYGYELKDTVGFGDNFNDLPLLLTVGRGYAMGNAPQAVKEQVGLVTGDHNHDGIAQALEALEISQN